MATGDTFNDLRESAGRFAGRFGDEAFYAALCMRSGIVGPELPHRVVQMGLALERYGMLGGAVAVAGIRHRDHLAVIDEMGELTWGELDQRINAIALAWIEDGLQAGDGVGILCRNHRGMLEALFAAAKCGAKIVLMNTGFSGPQVREVAEREGVDLLVYDEEFEERLGDWEPRLGRLRGWLDSRLNDDDTLEALIASTPPRTPPKPAQGPRIVILTSGTTGTPKGAGRHVPLSLSPVGGPLSKVPYRAREVTQMCAPIFHALGLSQTILAVALGSTIVLHRKFDPHDVIESIDQNAVTTMVMVPIMLQRLMAVEPAAWDEYSVASMRIIFVSGSKLSVDLADRVMARFGPVLYNLFGSTEVAYATIATPADMRAAPGTVGRVVHGAAVKVLDDDGREVPPGTIGRLFVGNAIQFEGYTGGGDKERLGGLMASGDVGHFDANGRLFIDGRDDEMVISGGENVFPMEVEETIGCCGGVADVAVIGVDDEQWGQRLRAFVVRAPGASVTEDEIRACVRDNLANYKVPRDIVFVRELPRNHTGKVLKRELADAR